MVFEDVDEFIINNVLNTTVFRSPDFQAKILAHPEHFVYATMGQIFPMVTIRQKSVERDNNNGAISLITVENIISKLFPMQD